MVSRIQPFSIIGHRGAPMLVPPGNTLASLQRAIEVGAQMVEVDVRSTQDDVLVVDHEAVRYFNGFETPLRERTYDEWKHLPTDAQVPLTTLEEVFALVRQASDGLDAGFQGAGDGSPARPRRPSIRPAAGAICSCPAQATPAARSSALWTRVFPSASPWILTMFPTITSKILSAVDTDAVTWHHKLITPAVVKVLQMQGVVVYAGVANLPEEMRRLRDVCKVDGILTDAPDLLRSI